MAVKRRSLKKVPSVKSRKGSFSAIKGGFTSSCGVGESLSSRVLSLLGEAYIDRILAKLPARASHQQGRVEKLYQSALKVFKKQHLVAWFLEEELKAGNGMLTSLAEADLGIFEHLYSLPMEPLKSYDPRGKSVDQALKELSAFEKEWQKKQKRRTPESQIKKGDEVLIDFHDGFKWMLLPRAYCPEEGEAMGHCGNSPRKDTGDRILSLREFHGDGTFTRHLTFTLTDEGLLLERKGFENHKPSPKYHGYVLSLLRNPVVKGFSNEHSHLGVTNDFQLWDITDQELDDLGKDRPEMLEKDLFFQAHKTKFTGVKKEGDREYEFKEGRLLSVYDTPRRLRTFLDEKGRLSMSEEYYSSGEVSIKRWYHKNELGRKDGPAVIRYCRSGQVRGEVWCRDGKWDRQDGPAYIWYSESGQVKQEDWYRDGKADRKDGPAYISYYESGQVEQEVWYRDGKWDRQDGPAVVRYYESGQVEQEDWYQNDKRDRQDGPAYLSY